ncbi:MAG: hypothetical protein HZB80_04470 [Deltaproteobacteria bacterium]|nr:hypothetical protein [Deltaproteobacteria bacterium]
MARRKDGHDEEQIQILNKLKIELQRIVSIIAKIQSQIATLKEYRQALISNVVTGKVRALDFNLEVG